MKRRWAPEELAEQWTLAPSELALLANKTGATRLGFALLLKCFQQDGRFPERPAELPVAVVQHVAAQVGVPAERFAEYDWTGRSIKYHRAQLRDYLGVRETTEADLAELAIWLGQEVVHREHHPERLRAALRGRCRILHLELPASSQLERLLRSVLHREEERLCQAILARLTPATLAYLDGLLAGEEVPAAEGGAAPR